MLWYRTHQTGSFASVELILYPLVFGGGSIIVIWLLKKYFLKEPLHEFNAGNGNLYSDLMWGGILALVYFLLFYIERITLANILSFKSNPELLGLMLDMRSNPLLIIIWFLPVLWIGIALYEELLRVFLLTGLWKFSESFLWKMLVIIIASVLVGLAHWSQGSYGIVTIAIKSMVAGVFFYRYQRLLPLIIAHALYDGIQVALFLITYPG